jgi:hypothetical protein
MNTNTGMAVAVFCSISKRAEAIVHTVYTTAVPHVQIRNITRRGNLGEIKAIGTALMKPQHVLLRMTLTLLALPKGRS